MEAGNNHEEHEGERYLKLLGLDHFADHQIPGRQEQVRDFLDICGEHARPMLKGLEGLNPDDPRYDKMRELLRTEIAKFVEISFEE